MVGSGPPQDDPSRIGAGDLQAFVVIPIESAILNDNVAAIRKLQSASLRCEKEGGVVLEAKAFDDNVLAAGNLEERGAGPDLDQTILRTFSRLGTDPSF